MKKPFVKRKDNGGPLLVIEGWVGLVMLHSGQGILVVRLRKVSERGIYCVILLYSMLLLNIVLFYLKYDVCSKYVTYELINMLKVFQSIGQYWSVSVNLNNHMNFGWRPRI